ncbi:Protein N-terminal glutamine amidohydrolase [Rhynchospora pubera]|uniref:Protein N-terminal glutamine amidohydrolase n=1 Tax=Rhynchospora pubera TaxID=906938 RepID=A0AAV8EIR9_9POAL|nr:Protein N-terminal glutamine amidohydrolase [Rhynchospora pubera]
MSRASMANETEVEIDRVGDLRAPTPSPSSSPVPPVDAAAFTHTPYYCEENVYLLCKKLASVGVADPTGLDLFVVFISNEGNKIPLWHQKASQMEEGLVVWDYHVICIQVKSKGNKSSTVDLVWDLDSTLPFPLPLDQYIHKAIRPLSFENSLYRRLFRVVHAPVFLRYFASDRSHMKDASGNWMALPPTYDPIITEDGITHNLSEYMKMHLPPDGSLKDMVDLAYANKYGVVVSEAVLEEFFCQIHV